MSYLLGIDVGSTNLKAVLFGYDGKIVAKADTPTELVRPEPDHPDWAVWQPQQIWSGIAQSIRKVVAGIDASALEQVARLYAEASPALVRCAGALPEPGCRPWMDSPATGPDPHSPADPKWDRELA